MEFWGYAATAISAGGERVTHPPALPALAALAHRLFGSGVLWPLWLLALLPGVLLAPAAAWLGARLDGAQTGWRVGLLILLLPASTATSLMVDSAALANLEFIALLGLALSVARSASPAAALALGLVGGLAVVTKEGGSLDLLLLALPALAMAPRRRTLLALLVGVGAVALPLALSSLAPELGGRKAALPMQHMSAWIQHGAIPAPLFHAGERALHLSPEEGQRFAELTLLPRVGAIVGVQLVRLVQLLGPLLVLLPALALARRFSPEARPLPRELLLLLGPRALLLLGGLFVVIQGRHAEWLVLPALFLLAALLSRSGARTQALSFVVLVLFCAGSLRAEQSRLRLLVAQAQNELAVARWIEQIVPAETTLVSPLYLVGAATMRTVARGLASPLPPVSEFLVLVRESNDPVEGVRALPPLLLPVAPRARLLTPGGTFGLYQGQSLGGEQGVELYFLHEDGSIQGEPPASQRRKPRSGRDRLK